MEEGRSAARNSFRWLFVYATCILLDIFKSCKLDKILQKCGRDFMSEIVYDMLSFGRFAPPTGRHGGT